jgi:hydroxymethylglutaryl-CoA synthase
VAAERRIARPASAQEMIFGDGAAAALVGHGAVLATLVAHRSEHADLVDHFRASGEAHDYGWEERWVRDEGYLKIAAGTLRQCLADGGVAAADVRHFVMPAPLARVNEAVARRLGIAADAGVSSEHETMGDLGSAQPLAMVDLALRRAHEGELILVAAFGSGCDALLLRRTSVPCPGGVPDAGRPETQYLKYLSFTGQIDLEWGMRAEMDNKTALTAAWRDHDRAARFEGGRCSRCGTVQFPRTHVCVHPECRAQDTQGAVSLADTPARVLSHTSDYLAYTPNPPFQFGHIDFDGGGRVMMEFADTDPDELRVGLPVRMVYRVKDFDRLRGFRRYFWKATPVRTANNPHPGPLPPVAEGVKRSN